ncbi:thioredoxin-like protein [Infundibulicybe gibba]|nr:thioredoxin-like protein [Infundibulicybe gibba]
MFSSFTRRLPEISIFHNPASPPSIKALALLRTSLSGPYPSENASAPPLQFNLDVVETPPTSDQLRTIMSYIPSKTANPSSALLSAHPSSPSPSEHPQGFSELANLSRQNPSAFKWPIVVDWTGGQASIGDVDGVKAMLETLRKRRDGELKDEDLHQPKGWFS